MSCVTPALLAPVTPESIIVDAARCWREAVDRHRPILPTLFARLEIRDAGFLAPAIAALLSILEAWSGRRFRAAHENAAALTGDEQALLGLIETATPPPSPHVSQPGLTRPLQIALRSTRILLQHVLGRDIEASGSPAGDQPVLLGCSAAEAGPLPEMREGDMAQDRI
ncbi:hypothetical protein [Sphingomonas sp. S2M10]|uniref:hypothetical protein n=1 Tax=Sphingomonas sp. S2M10 TaxID=2705010 RepID=UPI0014565A58|nr:hypothetical protein [Sphingomonas sp. S2M10]